MGEFGTCLVHSTVINVQCQMNVDSLVSISDLTV